MNKENLTTPPIFSEKLTVHSEIDGLLEINGSTPGPAGIAALDLGDELLEREYQGANWNFDLSIDFAEPKKLTNIVVDSHSLDEYRNFMELLIGSERIHEASESFRRESRNFEPQKISKSEKSTFWMTASPFANYVLAESRAAENRPGDLRELFARIESFASLNSLARSVENDNRYQVARDIHNIQRFKSESLATTLGDLGSQISEIAFEDTALLLVLKSQLEQFERGEMSADFRVTKLLRDLHLRIGEQVDRARFLGELSRRYKSRNNNVREIRNRGFLSDLEKYFASPVNEQQAFFDGDEIFLQDFKVERNLDTLQVFFASPLSAGKWVRVTDRKLRTPVALAEVLPNRRGAIAEIGLPFQAREEDLRFHLTSEPLRAKDQKPLTVRIRAIREGQVAAQRERYGDFIGASWHWLHCSNLWGVVEETANEKKAAKWAKKCFDKNSPDFEDDGFASSTRPRLSRRPDVLAQSMSLPKFELAVGPVRRTQRAKSPSKVNFLTDTAWSVLDDLGL